MGSSSSREDFERRQSEATYQARLKTDDGIAARERAMKAQPIDPFDASPNDPEAMMKLSVENDRQKEREAFDQRSIQQRSAYVKSQRDYFESVSEGMTASSIADRGGVQLASTTTIESSAAGIVAAGGQRKGSTQTIEGGAAGIAAVGGRKTGPHLGMGATFREQYNAVRWGAGMQGYRTLVRQYQKALREKKKNDGGLTAARQSYGAIDFTSHRPMFKVGAVTFIPMKFDGAIPLVGTFRAGETGWPDLTDGASDVISRQARRAGRDRWSQYSSGLYAPPTGSSPSP